VLLDEPLDANGSNKLGANGSIRVDANGSNSQTQMEVLAGANGSIMVDANGTVKSTLKHLLNTQRENTPTTQHTEGRRRLCLHIGNSKRYCV
jgi:flagellar basal body rod protein FlgF